jgi:hypothetical protein
VINKDDIRYMPAFMKFSGIPKEEAENIIKKSIKKYKKTYGKYDVLDANAFILNNILLGKVYDYSSNPYEKLPIEVLLGTIIHDTSDKDAWKWDVVGPFDDDYEEVVYPKFLNEESTDRIKSFNENRYNKFLDLMMKDL